MSTDALVALINTACLVLVIVILIVNVHYDRRNQRAWERTKAELRRSEEARERTEAALERIEAARRR